MVKSLVQNLLVVLILLGVCSPLYGQDSPMQTDSFSQAVYFRFDRVDIDPLYMDNQSTLAFLDSFFSDPVRVFSIDSIHIAAYASPEGSETHNIRLAQRRLEVMRRCLATRYPLLPQSVIHCKPGGENWDGLRHLVAQDTLIDEREEVLMILDRVKASDRREALLKQLNTGKAYRYIAQHILPLLRNAVAYTIWTNLSRQDLQHPVRPVVHSTLPHIPMLHASPHPRHPWRAPARKAENRYAALKTNLAGWGLTAVNLAYEVQLGNRLSLDLPLLWSSWDVSPRHALRIVALQPELRYWLRRPGSGHFFGIHAHAARYNLKWNDTRYQDNECPLLGAGLGYGYARAFNPRWGMEFNLGAGYAHSRYHRFRNQPNGPRLDVRTLRHWGITRLGVSIIYKLSRP